MSRRQLMQRTRATLLASLSLPVITPLRALAQPTVDESNPLAQALGYVHDATAAQHPRYQAGQRCANCRLYAAAASSSESAQWAPCPALQGQLVNAAGWCSAWASRRAE